VIYKDKQNQEGGTYPPSNKNLSQEAKNIFKLIPIKKTMKVQMNLTIIFFQKKEAAKLLLNINI